MIVSSYSHSRDGPKGNAAFQKQRQEKPFETGVMLRGGWLEAVLKEAVWPGDSVAGIL